MTNEDFFSSEVVSEKGKMSGHRAILTVVGFEARALYLWLLGGPIFSILFLLWKKILIYKFAIGETLRVSRRARARPMKRTCVFSLKRTSV